MNENIEDRLYQLEEDGKSQITSNDGGFHSGNLREGFFELYDHYERQSRITFSGKWSLQYFRD